MAILVVGSTGLVGGEIALKLQRRGHKVGALVRGGSSNARAKRLLEAGVEVIDGDLTCSETVASACKGVEIVISTATSMPSGANDGLRRVDHEGTLALIDAATRQNVKRFVYVSYSGNIREDSPLESAKRGCEHRLLAGTTEAVILRPSYFMEMWLSAALGFDPVNGAVRIYGSGDAKVSYISASNVADFAVTAATREYANKNTILEMGGPEALSQREAVRIFEQALNKRIKMDEVPFEAIEAQHRSSDPLQKSFGGLILAYVKGDVVKEAAALAHKYGIRLRSVSEYASGFRAQVAGDDA
ncbi:MAG: NmrA family NAD(P)-binding protein [Candidatus Acidiferrales bacterium]|jgi:NADH dehydrogenase